MRRFYLRVLQNRGHELTPAELRRTAVVFAPHQDDETLGCGGTIIKKRRGGADVKMVFLTDGSGSHSHIIPAGELKEIRAREAAAASQRLGVATENVFLLGFKDGELGKSFEAAVHRVTDILCQNAAEEVFVPYALEAPPDHVNTYQIVLAALKRCGLQATIYEYPIWFWFHWPWVGIWQGSRRAVWDVLRNTLAARLGSRLFTDFNFSVPIEDVREQKLAALNQHKSQMTQLKPDSGWLTLHDVAGGEWLACFFQEHEIFRRHHFTGGS